MEYYYEEIPEDIRTGFIEVGERKLAIVAFGIKPANQFAAHPHNFRTHPKKQQRAVNGSLGSLGWLTVVIENRITGNLIDGHERIWNALRKGEESLVPFAHVELSEEEEAQALLSLDPIGAMAGIDEENLAELLRQVEESERIEDDSRVDEYMAFLASQHGLQWRGEGDESYTRKIAAPIYEPQNKKPATTDLFDTSKTDELIAEIEAAEMPEDVKEFLLIAAQRHTIFSYEKIADYYAHVNPEIQKLMEDSALVIIDFNRAIELGFVRLAEKITDQFVSEYVNVR